jgi:hypothetical protein
MPTNAQRATWALTALMAYRTTHKGDGEIETDIRDLITDLLHLAHLHAGVTGIDGMVAQSTARFHEELADNPGG